MTNRKDHIMLLKYLIAHKGQLVTWENIKEDLPDYFPRAYMHDAIKILRKDHEIQTVQGVGYIYIDKLIDMNRAIWISKS